MVFLAKQEIGFYYEVVFGRSVEEGAFHVQAVRFCSVLQPVYFERVLQVNRIKDGFDVVVSVGTFFYYVESQVYLGVRECYHGNVCF